MPLFTFYPVTAKQGQAVTIQLSPPGPADKWEVWGYSTPNRTPAGQEGWSRIGETGGSGGTVRWDTSQWAVGNLTLTAIGYSGSAAIYHWQTNPSLLQTYGLQPPEQTSVPGPQPRPGDIESPNPNRDTKGIISSEGLMGISWEMVAIGAAAAAGIWWWMKGRGGDE